MQKSPVQKILDANERTADLAHRNDVLRGQRDFARRLAGLGWLSALALGTALGFLLSGCVSAAEVPADADRASLPAFQQVAPPVGYIGFCIRHPDECAGGTDDPQVIALTPDAWAALAEVNEHVNRLPQVEDKVRFGRDEWWAFPDERGGDCEDLALEKRRLLIERGFPAEALLLAVVRQWNGDGHAVLLVKTDRGAFVLDSMTWSIERASDAPYEWVKRQTAERPFIWVNLDPKAVRADAMNPPLPPVGQIAPFLAAVTK